MAKVTTISSIHNNSIYDIGLIDGEDDSKNMVVPGNWYEKCSIPIPWIGRQEEGHKAIVLKCGREKDQIIYIYQDYWYPPGLSQVKFREISPFIYSDDESNLKIDGDSNGGGTKYLTIFDVHSPDGLTIIGHRVELRLFDH